MRTQAEIFAEANRLNQMAKEEKKLRKISKHSSKEVCDIFMSSYEKVTGQKLLPWKISSTGLKERDRIYTFYMNYFELKGLELSDYIIYVDYYLEKWFDWIDGSRNNVVGFVFSKKNSSYFEKKSRRTATNSVAGASEQWNK